MEERKLILYADDFCKHAIWQQICNVLNVDSGFDKLTLTVKNIEVSTIEEGEEENE